MEKSIKIFINQNIGIGILLIIITMISCIKADNWKLPTAIDIQASFDNCKASDDALTINLNNSEADKGDIRCICTELGLWNDKAGFNGKRLGKMLSKHQRNIEILLVVTYCNDLKKQQNNLNKWAKEAYQCFAQGRMGPWINDYVRYVYKEKSLKS